MPAEDNAFDALVWDDRRDIYFSKELTETNETDKSRDADSLDGEFAHSEYLDAKDAHDDVGRKDSKQPSNESLRDATEEVFSQLGTDFDLFADEHEGIE